MHAYSNLIIFSIFSYIAMLLCPASPTSANCQQSQLTWPRISLQSPYFTTHSDLFSEISFGNYLLMKYWLKKYFLYATGLLRHQGFLEKYKRPMKVVKAKSKARGWIVSFFQIFWCLWLHLELLHWKMPLVNVPRPKRPLKAACIVETTTCKCRCQYTQICFSSIIFDIIKHP